MAVFGTLSQRHRQPEMLDQGDLPADQHAHALQGLERINWWSGSARILWPEVRKAAAAVAPRPLQLQDVATGAGYVPTRLWKKAARSGVSLQITGCDRSPRAVAYAQARARRHTASIDFRVCDVLREPLPGEYDVIVSSLFLHHLDPEEAVLLLRKMAQCARGCVLINDLVRSTTGYLLAVVGTRFLSTSKVVHVDGPISVQSAFTVAEARQLAAQAGLKPVNVRHRWPYRYLLVWKREGNVT
jgi:2-polyprenyl-3-methyl-5-hydroxy-6-metoxy-1,4-benzoquinol methylase